MRRPTLRLVLLTLLIGLAALARRAHAAPGNEPPDLQAAVTRAVQAARLGKTRVAVCVIDVGANRMLAALNAGEPLIPASNMKLVTTAAALAALGPEFTFQTELRLLEADPDAAVVAVKADGDPAFCDPKLLAAHQLEAGGVLDLWVKAVRDAGVRKVARLVLDDRVFDRETVHPAWPPDQLDRWFAAPVTGLMFSDNCVDVYAAANAPGQPARIALLPSTPVLTVVNRTVSGGAGEFLVAFKGPGQELVCSGSVRGRATEPISVPVADPVVFFGRVLAQRLAAAGVPVTALAQPGYAEALPEGKVLHVVQSSLAAVLDRCNRDSQNLFAEALLKRLGRQATGQPGSWAGGAAAVQAFLAQRLGGRATPFAVSDGSGLSKDNRVTAAGLAELLASMLRDPKLGGAYYRSLAAASDGSRLGERLERIGLGDRLRAKTGYVAGVSTFSGYLTLPPPAPASAPGQAAAPPRVLAFAFLANDCPNVAAAHDLQNDLVRLLEAQAPR